MTPLSNDEEELALHIFICVMVLIRDFYDAFEKAYQDPAEPETALCIELIWYAHIWTMQKIASQHGSTYANELSIKLAAFLVAKIKSELPQNTSNLQDNPLKQSPWQQITGVTNEHWLTDNEIFQSMTEEVITSTGDISDEFKAYARGQIERMFTESVDFDSLVSKLQP